jgi:hypothetical protein
MKIRARIDPRKPAQRFYRCGVAFTPEWLEVDVDAATAARMLAEQMLEVAVVPEPAPEAAAQDAVVADTARAPEPAPAKPKKPKTAGGGE